MLYQDMLKLAAINSNKKDLLSLANSITEDEWKQRRLGNKKLSKELLKLGLDNETVSNLLSVNVDNTITRIVSDEDTCLNQGNSIYYSSCQATDDRAKHSAYDIEQTHILGDLKHLGKSLFFWVAGNSMSVDGKGFTARAKLRIMYADESCTHIFGLWIEKIYGNALILLSNFQNLQEWWGDETPIYVKGSKQQSLVCYIPSCNDGYQDTAEFKCSYYEVFDNESLIKRAYKSRNKVGGVYQVGLNKVKFNPQNCELSCPKVESKRYRGHITSKIRKQINYLIDSFGFPKSTELLTGTYRTTITLYYEVMELHAYFSDSFLYLWINDIRVFEYEENCLIVRTDNYGFYKAKTIPYIHNNRCIEVIYDDIQLGFAQAWDIAYRRYYTINDLEIFSKRFIKQ